MRRHVILMLLITVAACCSRGVYAQSLEERVKRFADEFAKGYTGPGSNAFGASLNSGWYHTANVDDGLDLFIGVRLMLMPIPDDGKKFKIASIWNGTVQEVPTFFGDETETPISGVPGTASPQNYPKGFNIGFFPMFIPHISAGNIFGTRAMLRFLPKTKIGDLGEFEFFGIGVQHSISRYVPLIPLDLSALVAYQSLSLGSLISAKAFTIGAQASKSFVLVTLYGGLAYESSTLSFSYDATFTQPPPPGTTVSRRIGFDTDGKNNFRGTVGLALSLAIIKITADYSIASQPVATLGIGVGW